jgi:hypothetical protein
MTNQGNMTKKNPMRWIIVVGGIALFAILIYLSMGQMRQEYEVCMAFKGSTHCATAAGSTQNEAIRSAEEIDCQMLASGRDETMACLNQAPSSVRPTQK